MKKALSKDPKLRYPSCRDFARELEEAYGRSKSGSFSTIHSIKKAGAIPSASKIYPPWLGLAAEAPRPLDAAELVKGRNTRPHGTMPSRETRGTGEHKENFLPSSHDTAETAVQSHKRKSKWVVWAAGLGLVVLAGIAFYVKEMTQKPEASAQIDSVEGIAASENTAADIGPPSGLLDQAANQEGTATPPASSAQTDLEKIVVAEIAASRPTQADASASPSTPVTGVATGTDERKKAARTGIAEQKLPKETGAPQLSSVRPDSKSLAEPEASASGQKRTQIPASQPEAASGVLEWSGDLQKNSILVITEQGPSIGSLTGQLPGTPVKIEVEPKGLTIRQMPREINGWRHVILYSGNQKYSSIAIRWKSVE